MGHSKQSSKQEPSLPIRELLVGVWTLKTYTDTHTGTSELQPPWDLSVVTTRLCLSLIVLLLQPQAALSEG